MCDVAGGPCHPASGDAGQLGTLDQVLCAQIAMLQDGGGQSYAVGKKRSRPDSAHAAQTVPRPSKVRAMLAMRACRGSIMIGKALSRAQMQQTVSRLADLDSPWNCPHGRPTMRHVCGLCPSS
jgi:hypothetical protein